MNVYKPSFLPSLPKCYTVRTSMPPLHCVMYSKPYGHALSIQEGVYRWYRNTRTLHMRDLGIRRFWYHLPGSWNSLSRIRKDECTTTNWLGPFAIRKLQMRPHLITKHLYERSTLLGFLLLETEKVLWEAGMMDPGTPNRPEPCQNLIINHRVVKRGTWQAGLGVGVGVRVEWNLAPWWDSKTQSQGVLWKFEGRKAKLLNIIKGEKYR